MSGFKVVYPPALPQLDAIAPNTIIIGYDPITGKTVRIQSQLLLTGTGYPAWDPAVTYPAAVSETDQIVIFNLRFWQSIQADNLNNVPTEGDWWTEVSPEGIPLYNIDGGVPDSEYGTINELDGGSL
jgi:hypothetical protein